MLRAELLGAFVAGLVGAVIPGILSAQEAPASAPAVVCASKVGERQVCAADTKAGVTLLRSTGSVACERGKTWGYDQRSIWVSDGCSAEFSLGKGGKQPFGTYTPLRGFKLVDTDQGDVNFKIYTYVRYLNQLGLDETHTDDFGETSAIDRRQDIQLQKVNIQFFGWLLDRGFRYHAYVWTSNVSQGLGAQVVVGGSLTYKFNEHISLAGGIGGLPGVRTTEGNFPLWLTTDNRLLAEEFFRPSYTMGVWAKGRIVPGLNYHLMLGNNLSQLGIDAGQLDDGLNTWSVALTWMPTTGEFGTMEGLGDFDHHERAATRVGGHFTRSDENFQSQPSTDAFENVQLRLSDGNNIFTPDLFGPGIRITDATYHMGSLDAGLKYRGFSLEGGYYWRLIDDFRGTGTTGLDDFNDHGFQLQASAMAVPRLLQVYVSGSKVFGEHGDPADVRVGVNWYPWRNQVVRWNAEYLHLNRSPVGGLSLPYVVGGNGSVVYSTFEVNF